MSLTTLGNNKENKEKCTIQNVIEWRFLAKEKPNGEGFYKVLCEDGTIISDCLYCKRGWLTKARFDKTESKIIAFR